MDNKPLTQNAQKTVIQNVLVRAAIIFSTMTALILTSFSLSLYAGFESGEIKKRIIKPLQDNANAFVTYLETTPTPFPTFPPLPTLTPVPTATPSAIPVQKRSTEVYYVYPTMKPFPTIVPGEPGSKEWDEAFKKRWDEMGKHNAEMQKKVEDSQKAFCEKNPNLCN